ncbi:30S ribosomal protein S20 [Candidatus Cerribacteria bacterium 'Amazon FNV 2010 28 9']|uniref:Small ribosomal subunit protein bS20 n=1 Tax=Candidatus Cerribacteria bacterium 'Amazon FNV 2010 28 9' TaxID=2081795 RepID=A0A317JQK1_9BACT|nr:MAG: 30S ribosomal protein S20 [Candidatus Cerribacteria bacterium 'Amazon FNV 2010 28 9']
MPITKSALKALRQDKRRTQTNRPYRTRVKTSSDTVKATPSTQNLSSAFSAIDRAVKKNIMHKNKAARLKSALSKFVK